MKSFKKVMAVVFAAVLAMSCFAGCSNDAKGKFFIGATGPLTGDAAQYGVAVERGAKLAVEEINAAGGLNGIQFYFDMKDDKATAADASSAFDALMDAGMQISLGSVTSGSCKAFGQKAAEEKVFFMTPSASEEAIITASEYAFRVCFGDPDQGTLAAQEIAKNFTKVGCIYDNSSSYSSGIFDAFAAEMKKIGMDFTAMTFDGDSNKDFSTQAEALKDCDVIFLPIYYTEAGLIAKACTAKGCNAVLFGCDGLDGIDSQIDATIKNTIKYITPFDLNSTDAFVAAFVKNFKAKYGVDPDQFAADGYDAVYAIYNAMKNAGVKDADITPADLSKAVIDAITAASFKYNGCTGAMTWDKTGACTKEPVIVELNKK